MIPKVLGLIIEDLYQCNTRCPKRYKKYLKPQNKKETRLNIIAFEQK